MKYYIIFGGFLQMKGEVNMNNLMKFESQEVEVFEYNGKVLFNPYHVGRCLELSDSSVRMAIRGMNSKQVILMKNADVNNIDIRKFNPRGENFLTESGVYKLIFKSRKKEAEKFSDWVTDEVLPAIRQTGKYETKKRNQEVSIEFKPTVKRCGTDLVLVTKDLSEILGVSVENICMIIKKHDLWCYRLENDSLKKFKQDNPNVASSINYMFAFNEAMTKELLRFIKCSKEALEKINMYFNIDGLGFYEKLRIMELAKDIMNVANNRGINTPYHKMLTLVASKIYVDCGFLDEVTEDLSIHNPIGWNLQQPLIDFMHEVKRRLI